MAAADTHAAPADAAPDTPAVEVKAVTLTPQPGRAYSLAELDGAVAAMEQGMAGAGRYTPAEEAAARAMFDLRPVYVGTGDKPERWTWDRIGPDSQDYHRKNARAALRAASLPPAPAGGGAAADTADVRRQELHEIADGAYGDDTRTRGAARDELARLAAGPTPRAAPEGVVAWRAWSESGQAWRLYHEDFGVDADLTKWEPLYTTPRDGGTVPAGAGLTAAPLTANFVNAFPDGTCDESRYDEVEYALDRAGAESTEGGRWLKLPERVAALAADRDRLRAQIDATPAPGAGVDLAGVIAVLDQEELYLTDAVRHAGDEDGPGVMPGDVEGSFFRIRTALDAVRALVRPAGEIGEVWPEPAAWLWTDRDGTRHVSTDEESADQLAWSLGLRTETLWRRGDDSKRAWEACRRANDRANKIQAKLDAAIASRTAGAEAGSGVTAAARDVLAERRRQVEGEGWTPEHDDKHQHKEMSRAAACYCLAAEGMTNLPHDLWPWEDSWFKYGDHRGMLVKAGALILAEIERRDRSRIASEDRAHASGAEGGEGV